MQNAKRVKKGFDLLAPFYDAGVHLFLGRKIEYSQQFFLSGFSSCPHVLIFGGGTGYLLPELLNNPDVRRICYVDISEKMIGKARKRIVHICPERLHDIDFVCGSYLQIPHDYAFDLLITPYVLDCFEQKELELLVPYLSKRIGERGQWLFVDFNTPESGFPRLLSRFIVRPLYFFFNILCGLKVHRLPAFDKVFASSSWNLRKEHYFCSCLLTAKVYSRSE